MKILVVEGDSGTMVYCKSCGAIAGVPTCPQRTLTLAVRRLGMSLKDLARHLGISVPGVGYVKERARLLQPEMVIN